MFFVSPGIPLFLEEISLHLFIASYMAVITRYVTVENKEKLVSKLVSNDIKSNQAKIVERQKMTYAEAVKMQNRECMEEMKQHLTPASSH